MNYFCITHRSAGAGTHRGSRELAPWRGPGEQPGRVWGAGVQWTPLSRRLRSADRAGRRDPAAQQGHRRHAGGVVFIIPVDQ